MDILPRLVTRTVLATASGGRRWSAHTGEQFRAPRGPFNNRDAIPTFPGIGRSSPNPVDRPRAVVAARGCHDVLSPFFLFSYLPLSQRWREPTCDSWQRGGSVLLIPCCEGIPAGWLERPARSARSGRRTSRRTGAGGWRKHWSPEPTWQRLRARATQTRRQTLTARAHDTVSLGKDAIARGDGRLARGSLVSGSALLETVRARGSSGPCARREWSGPR
jgi:hypothetical protein